VTIDLRFLGVGDASQQGLGHASICIEQCINEESNQTLLVDCGPGTLDRFLDHYQTLPDAVFITHCHLDHIADLEKLFIKCWFSSDKHRPLMFVPVSIIALLHERLATYPGALAEGGVNFWEAFRLIPVSRSFECFGLSFDVWPARHHGFESAFSLSLADQFYFTGDTRPIPEILEYKISKDSMIFHDCSVVGNPSHSGLDDLQKEYSQSVQDRIHVYHYNNEAQRQQFLDAGFHCVRAGDTFSFS